MPCTGTETKDSGSARDLYTANWEMSPKIPLSLKSSSATEEREFSSPLLMRARMFEINPFPAARARKLVERSHLDQAHQLTWLKDETLLGSMSDFDITHGSEASFCTRKQFYLLQW